MLPGAPAHPTRATKSAHRLALISAPVLCSVLLLGGYAWHQHQAAQHQRRLVAEASARLRDILISEQGLTESVIGMPSGMTYDEFFRACDRSLEEREKLVVAVRLLQPDTLVPLRERVVSHIRNVNELVRAKANLMHLIVRWRSMGGENLLARSARLKAEFFQRYGGGEREAIEWAYKRIHVEIDVLAGEINESANEFDALYDKCVNEEQDVLTEARRAGITFEPTLKKLAAENKNLSANARARVR